MANPPAQPSRRRRDADAALRLGPIPCASKACRRSASAPPRGDTSALSSHQPDGVVDPDTTLICSSKVDNLAMVSARTDCVRTGTSPVDRRPAGPRRRRALRFDSDAILRHAPRTPLHRGDAARGQERDVSSAVSRNRRESHDRLRRIPRAPVPGSAGRYPATWRADPTAASP